MINKLSFFLLTLSLSSCMFYDCSQHHFGTTEHKTCLNQHLALEEEYNKDYDDCRKQAFKVYPSTKRTTFYKDGDRSESYTHKAYDNNISRRYEYIEDCVLIQKKWNDIYDYAQGKKNDK